MDKKAMLMVVCLLCTGLFTADTLQALELADLPSAVQKTVKRELGSARVDEIERDTEDGKVVYEVEAETADGREIELEVAEDGTLLEKKEEVRLTDLPAAVRAMIERELGGVIPEKIERQTEEGTIRYEVDAETADDRDIDLDVAEDGTLLEKKEEVRLADVPPAVRATIKRELGSVMPEQVERVTEKGTIHYEVEAEVSGKEIELEIGEDGTLLDKEVDDDDDDDGDDDATCLRRAAGPVVGFKYQPTGLQITIDGKPFAAYYTGSSKIPRPYFAHVKTPSGIQVSRNHPPIEGKDSTDHDTFHPGIWLTFAGINGNDYWRLEKKTEHEMYIGKPKGVAGSGTFTVSNYYLNSRDSSGNRIAHEICRYTILVRPSYYILIYDSTISSDERDLVFGDDQEYGLGIRVATPIEERHGGQILNAEGLKGEEGTYGKASDWCDYSGVIDDTLVGMTIMPDPNNFRRSWYHTRDYGLIAANPFGRKKVAGGEKSEVLVKKGEKFHLGFGIAIYSGPKGSKIDRKAMYQDYLKAIGAKPK
jgi:uncharacterized membrane protein YkoI